MTTALAVVVGIVAFLTWRAHAYRRRVRIAHTRLDRMHRDAQERAARAATAPHTGHVAASPIHPPKNGRP